MMSTQAHSFRCCQAMIACHYCNVHLEVTKSSFPGTATLTIGAVEWECKYLSSHKTIGEELKRETTVAHLSVGVRGANVTETAV